MNVLDQLPPSRPMPTARHHAARRQLEDVVVSAPRTWWRVSRGVTGAVVIGLVIAGGAAAAVLLTSKGPIPFTSNGSIEWNKVPNYISVYSGGKVVGYAPRADVLLPPTTTGGPLPKGFGSTPIPVYSNNLHTLKDHLYPDLGYVALGTAPSSVACEPITVYEGTSKYNIACPSVTVTLPNLIGMSTPTAAGKLSGLGVVVNVINTPSSLAPKGTVISMTPAPVSVVASRSIVTIENSSKSNG